MISRRCDICGEEIGQIPGVQGVTGTMSDADAEASLPGVIGNQLVDVDSSVERVCQGRRRQARVRMSVSFSASLSHLGAYESSAESADVCIKCIVSKFMPALAQECEKRSRGK